MTQFALCKRNINIQPDFIWKIKGFKKLMKRKTFEVKSEVFAWNGYPVNAYAQLKLKQDDQMYVSLNLKEINIGEAIDIKPIPKVSYVIRDAQTKRISRSVSYLIPSKFTYSLNYESSIALNSSFIDEWCNEDDCVVIEIYVESPSMAQRVYSYDGILHWSVNTNRKRKQMERDGLVWYYERPYFYTGPRGYRVQADVYVNERRESEGKGLRVDISLLPGEFYEELSMNFPHQTTVTLLNRKDPQHSITKSVNRNIEEGEFYSIDVLCDEKFDSLLENDTLYYTIIVKSIE